MPSPPASTELRWLIRFRWVVSALGTAALAGAHLSGWWSLPVLPMLGAIAALAVSNLGLAAVAASGRARRAALLTAVLLLDTALFTTILALSGGPTNPLSSLYFVLAVVGALVLDGIGTWLLLVATLAAYGSLFTPTFNPHAHHLDGHLVGMWVAFAAVAPLLAFSVRRLRRLAADAEADAVSARASQARAEKLGALGTLAAGAAHELATPLATISVAAHELLRCAADHPHIAEDARLIGEQVARAKEVLGQLSADAGSGMGEVVIEVRDPDLVEAALDRMGASSMVKVCRDASDRPRVVRVPRRQLARALRGLLQNACDASPEGAEVLLTVGGDADHLRIEVDDEGAGMSDEVLRRVGEPFFTTKGTESGMGLGVFFARSVLERCHGSLEYERRPGGGIRAVVLLPASEEAA